jgi:proteasome accessory factor C
MVEQAKILRVFKLISMLKARPRTIPSIAKSMETTTRTIYRYLDLLDELGFLIDKDWKNQFFIHTTEEQDNEMHFNGEESVVLHEVISTALRNHPLKDEMLRKLFVHSDLKLLPEQLLKARLGQLVQKLVKAMKNQNSVILNHYHSAHSDSIRDRLVEPFDFSEEYGVVIALDIGDKKVKQFKIERMANVTEQDKPWNFEQLHVKPPSDIFGLTGGESHEVILELSLRAYLLMREEFPRSIPFLSKEEEGYFFRGNVIGLNGIGRFVLGLLDEIKVVRPKALTDHLMSRISNSEHHSPAI